ncbi:MAG: restriction endonuclease [Alphaproteobacteria bacterium]|nr:restriction endonuclease [Alphaproteobacteria bacterium]
MTTKDKVPQYTDLLWPTLQALKLLGGSGNVVEILDKIVEIQKYPESIQNVLHLNKNFSELSYRAAWARTYLKNVGAIENSAHAVWSITKYGEAVQESDLKGLHNKAKSKYMPAPEGKEPTEKSDGALNWKDELLEILQAIDPSDFEKLCQRLLRESGFVKVTVTGKSNDGGIDGTGVLRVNLLSFQILFQCKRYKGSVGSSTVRDFRGAMAGRTDKGLIITTGSFTSEARKEATRDGAPAIDLIDGQELCDLLKDLKMGVKTIESAEIDKDWFKNL